MGCNCKNKATGPNVSVYIKSTDVDRPATTKALVEGMKYSQVQADITFDMMESSGKVMIFEGTSTRAANIIRYMASRGIQCEAKSKV